jgi:hypothetical protein
MLVSFRGPLERHLTKFQQGFSKLHLLTEDALNWLQQIKNI